MGDQEYYFVTNSETGRGKGKKSVSKYRSHAVKRALLQQRQHREQQLDNFRIVTINRPDRKPKSLRWSPRNGLDGHGLDPEQGASMAVPPYQTFGSEVILSPRRSLSPGMLDPFRSLAANSARLQFFLRQEIAEHATEPICTIGERLAFQNFHCIFRCGFEDPALLNSIMLALAFAHSGSVDRECLEYQSKALACIRQQIHCREGGTKEATIGAILLIAGVDAQLGLRPQAEVHMRGIQDLMASCVASGTVLSHGIRRAIFWQDLNTSVMTGSRRYLDHESFPELLWRRDPFLHSIYTLPLGFEAIRHLMSARLVETFEDIHGLQHLREHSDRQDPRDTVAFMHTDNAQAWIESRLWQPDPSSRPALLDFCRHAAYLCTYWFYVEMWGGVTSPVVSHVSRQLSQRLQQASEGPEVLDWEGRYDLLAWILFVGGSLSPSGLLRSEYVALLHGTYKDKVEPFFQHWKTLLQVLQRFIWSQKVFGLRAKGFWEECSLA